MKWNEFSIGMKNERKSWRNNWRMDLNGLKFRKIRPDFLATVLLTALRVFAKSSYILNLWARWGKKKFPKIYKTRLNFKISMEIKIFTDLCLEINGCSLIGLRPCIRVFFKFNFLLNTFNCDMNSSIARNECSQKERVFGEIELTVLPDYWLHIIFFITNLSIAFKD